MSRAWRGSWRCVVSVILGLQFLLSSPLLAEKIVREYEIKAAFVLKFLDFSDISAPQGGNQICVLGVNPFGDSLERLQSAHPNRYRDVSIRHIEASADVAACNIAFISQSLSGELESILARFSASPTLTVSDIAGFARQGGMIELVVDGKNIKFVINPQSAKTRGVTISSQLLALAKEIVATEGDQP